MKNKKKIYIISNESIHVESNNFSCDNVDLKSIPEGLNNIFDTTIIARQSKLKRFHLIKKLDVKLAKNIFSFIKMIYKSINKKDQPKYLIISITPFTFIACLIFFLFNIKPLVYLRSDGYKEYKSIIGNLGVIIYHIMFTTTALFSKLISCRKHILKGKKGIIVSPSQLTSQWSINQKEVDLNKAKLLYVGRLRIEKGIFSFLELFEKSKDFNITIVSPIKDHSKIKKKENIFCLDTQPESSLITLYDEHNIFILPSFTEGHPQVLDESLSRCRPVIVFEDIEHVKRDREGVFVCKRNFEDFNQTVKFILKNYHEIQSKIKKNKLPNKKSFLKELELIINDKNI